MFTSTRAETLDVEGLGLALFGLASSALVDPSAIEAIDNVASALLAMPEALGSEFAAGRFLVPLLAMREMPAESQTRQRFTSLCREAMQDISADALASPEVMRVARGIALGRPREPQTPGLIQEVAFGDSILRYAAPTPLIRRLTLEIGALSDFGRSTLSLPCELLDEIRQALNLWTFCYVKEQDLDMVCPLARSLASIGDTDTPEYRDAIAFILHRQRADGHFSMQDLSVSTDGLKKNDFDPQREAMLPLTVASIWTLLPVR